MERQMVVATLYKLMREDGRFTKDNKKVLRKEKVVPIATVEKYNENWKSCGKYYEVHEKLTEKYYEESDVRNTELAEGYKAEGQLSNAMIDLAKGASANTNPVDAKANKAAEEKAADEADAKEIEGLVESHDKALVAVINAEEVAKKAKEAYGKAPEDEKLKVALVNADKAVVDSNNTALKAEGALDAAKGKIQKPGLLDKIMSAFNK